MSATASSSAAGGSGPTIIPSTGISHIAKLLFVTSKLHTRNLISKEEKRLLKQLAIRQDQSIMKIDLASPNFLTALIDLASSIAITAASNTFHEFLFRHCSTSHAKSLSKNQRKEAGITENSFVYGEIDFLSFAQILKEIRPLLKADGIFVDLGSGTGRPCFAMALLSDMKRIVGIEYLSSLVDQSKDILEKYENFVESDEVEEEADEDEDETSNAAPGTPVRAKKVKKVFHSPLAKLERRNSVTPPQARIEFIQGDFLEHDWSEADFVFLNSTCYSPALMQKIAERAANLKPGSVVVSLTKSLNSQDFTVVSKRKWQMSWGSATSYVHRRN